MKYIVFIMLLQSSLIKISAQSYLEFIENKGQWDNSVSFKGQMVSGSFLLKPDGGYRVILNNANDITAIASRIHGKAIGTNAVNTLASIKNSNSSNDTNLVLHSHAYEVKFLNANPNPVAVPDKALNTYNNYFIGNDKSKWASNCKIYQAVTYKNVYPNVDVRYYTSSAGQLKYDIIVNPGGDVNKIALYFDGAESLKIKEGTLSVKTSVDEVKEMPPVSYIVADEGKQVTDCNYVVKGNIVSFNVKKYAANKTLVIDPTLVFCTFTGSTADNWGYTATYDNGGNFYAGGIVFNPGFPVTNGAFQTSYKGATGGYANGFPGFDMGIFKFDSTTNAHRVYATYLGGANGNDQPHSLIVDASGNLIIAGRSTSSDYPVTLANPGTGGGWDIVITKLNSDGTNLIGSLRIGGSGNDGVNIGDKYETIKTLDGSISLRQNYGDDSRSEVNIDNAGNIYVASCTQSKDFPTVNAIQTKNNGGTYFQDAVVIKVDPAISKILFSTYLGGTGDDAAYVIDINPLNNNLYIGGGTASLDFPGDKTNTITNFAGVNGSSFNGGTCDGFLTILANDGSQIIKTIYFGSNGVDQIYGIKFDKFGFPFIMGTTTSSLPVLNSPWNTTDAVGTLQKTGNQFITKLSQDLSSVIYSANFGTANSTAPNISPTAFLVDRCGNVYVSGWGGLGNTGDHYISQGTLNLSITNDAIQKTTDGSDFYFFVLAKNAQSQLYGSWFGQKGGGYPDHVDGGTSRFDKNGIIYQAECANCYGGANFPTTPGVWATKNGTTQSNGTVTGCNEAAIKIAFNLAGVGSDIVSTIRGIPRDVSGCVPLSVDFNDANAASNSTASYYIWNYGDNTKPDTTTNGKSTHIYSTVGNYPVKLISVDPNSCNISDSSFIDLRVRNDDAVISFTPQRIGNCSSNTYQFINTSQPPATSTGKPFGSKSFIWDFGDGVFLDSVSSASVTHTYAAPGNYNVKLVLSDTNYCNYPDSIIQQLSIASNVNAIFSTSSVGCAPYTAIINNNSIGATQFNWDFGDGTTSSQQNPSNHLYSNIGTYKIKLTATNPLSCNITNADSIILTVSGKPTSSFTYSPQPPQANTAVVFTNNSIGGVKYTWLFGDGDSLITTTLLQPVSYIYGATQTYNACLVTTNSAGCMDTTCQSIHAIVYPLCKVPTAFSPNGDGVNDKLLVKGYGIEEMVWQIYNRWGTLVFISTNQSVGWDGTYKGVLQPQDVYHYVLQVKFTNKSSTTLKGDITLLR